jgi:hypothetical protein
LDRVEAAERAAAAAYRDRMGQAVLTSDDGDIVAVDPYLTIVQV